MFSYFLALGQPEETASACLGFLNFELNGISSTAANTLAGVELISSGYVTIPHFFLFLASLFTFLLWCSPSINSLQSFLSFSTFHLLNKLFNVLFFSASFFRYLQTLSLIILPFWSFAFLSFRLSAYLAIRRLKYCFFIKEFLIYVAFLAYYDNLVVFWAHLDQRMNFDFKYWTCIWLSKFRLWATMSLLFKVKNFSFLRAEAATLNMLCSCARLFCNFDSFLLI